MTNLQRRPHLDGLRGVAIVLVLAYHGRRVLPGGYVGVDLFFVLSGFLITSTLLNEMDHQGRIDLAGFYRRRAARLVPALALNLALGLALYAMLNRDALPAAARSATSAITYTTDLVVGFYGPLAVGPFLFAWSLAIEEQFYLVWPIVLRHALRERSRHRLGLALVFASVLVMVARALAHDWTVAYFQPQYRCDGLLVGAALALLPMPRPRKGVLFVGGALIGATAFVPPDVSASQVVAHSLASVGAAALVIAATDSPLLATPGLRHLGRISYSLYLWNSLLAGLFLQGSTPTAWAIPVWLAASLLLAHVSTLYLEEPLRARWRARRSMLVVRAKQTVTTPSY